MRTQIFPRRESNGGVRIRVSSHGPPLRNINGDSHSLLEEDFHDLNAGQHMIGG
jgi:hypothetical protein